MGACHTDRLQIWGLADSSFLCDNNAACRIDFSGPKNDPELEWPKLDLETEKFTEILGILNRILKKV